MHDLLPTIPEQLSKILNDVHFFVPELYLSALFILVLLADLFIGKNSEKYCRAIAMAGLVIVFFKDYEQYTLTDEAGGTVSLFSGMLLLYGKAVSFKVIIDLLTCLLLLYFAWDNKLSTHKKGLSDLYTIIIGSVLGLHLMTMATNLLSIYLAIEMVSIASYLMVAYRSENGFSAEAGLKYVLFGAASSAVLLYGISLLYGFTGTLDIWDPKFMVNLSGAGSAGVGLALSLVLVGIGFKLSFVPVHFWVPDVYEGAATPVTAYLSTVPKIAAFALLINFVNAFVAVVPHPDFDFRLALSIIGVITMIAGNFAAVAQQNVKRMLAYSSIGHTGFALMAVVTYTPQGLTSLIYYLAVYAVANIAALLLATYFTNQTGAEKVGEYKGLGFKYPIASVCFVIILISLTGLPVSAGFTGKLFVFSSVYVVYQQSHDVWLLILMITGAVVTVVSLFYYIKIPLNLFLRKSSVVFTPDYSDKKVIVLAVVLSLLLLLFGIFPDWLYKTL
ncbi:NADH-quinone oxidoreductase subunit N [Mucilaginibacter sp. UR6-1]|uniref:NADH-quinone oxidoreductase subunit N n=1 Tax=Mucilaginibacter sp. UR6-1 TaxID=1435643 RepID=UPI001E5C8D5B|nr:NADH-quinone oxidoreductase subunit N [Mucilaginibacter sp. UR6-1]MCC8408922.1 NADH-quinone oxidoreductase subunit N [Mucilaginibacter sp. UR6-1]